MTDVLIAVAILLVLVAFGVQLYYVRGLMRAGVEVSSSLKFITYINMGLLLLVALGLAAFALFWQGG